MRMHEAEVPIDDALVERLVATQFPRFAGLPIRAVASTGTVNAIYRIGDAFCARLPRLHAWAGNLEKEAAWLPVLAPHLSLRIPEPIGTGKPTNDYPFTWAIYRWIVGEAFRDDIIDGERGTAAELARFVAELRQVDPAGAPRGGRKPLQALDAVTTGAIEASGDAIDRGLATAAWQQALEAPAWNGEQVWIHADLLRPNLLVHGGQLSAVIDFGSAGVGDPAADLIAAWSVFGPTGRAVFREALDADDGTWRRARGYALHQAVLIIPYYTETNPEFVALARRTVEEILADIE